MWQGYMKVMRAQAPVTYSADLLQVPSCTGPGLGAGVSQGTKAQAVASELSPEKQTVQISQHLKTVSLLEKVMEAMSLSP
jgi:hypothetical protein